MRLWSLHPKYLDRQGLLGLWREGLLAQKVLLNEVKAYQNHPQLERFKKCPDPTGAIGYYLYVVAKEGERRGYNFDFTKIKKQSFMQIPVTIGQMVFEWVHLSEKLKRRSGDKHFENELTMKKEELLTHPLFSQHFGAIETWEKWKPEDMIQEVEDEKEEKKKLIEREDEDND